METNLKRLEASQWGIVLAYKSKLDECLDVFGELIGVCFLTVARPTLKKKV